MLRQSSTYEMRESFAKPTIRAFEAAEFEKALNYSNNRLDMKLTDKYVKKFGYDDLVESSNQKEN